MDAFVPLVHSKPITLKEKYFHWNLKFAISLMAKSLTLNSAYYYIFFMNLPMIAYIIEIQKSKSSDILFREFDQSEPVC